MERQRIYLVAVIALFQYLNPVDAYGYGSSGRGTTPPSSSEEDHEQWGGIGHGGTQSSRVRPTESYERTTEQSQWDRRTESYGQANQQPNRGHTTENYGQASQQTSNTFGNSQQRNQFAKETHIERYGYPRECVLEVDPQHVCNYYVEITKERGDPQNLHFELTYHIPNPNSGGYVAVGLSKDQRMGEDHYVECVKLANTTTVSAYHSWSERRARPTRLQDDHTIFAMEYTSFPNYDVDQRLLRCRFKRPVITNVEVPNKPPVMFDLERGKYFVLLAVGPTLSFDSDVLGYHGDNPLESGHAIVSPNLLGYSQENYPPSRTAGQSGGFEGNSGQAVKFYGFSFAPFYFIYYILLNLI